MANAFPLILLGGAGLALLAIAATDDAQAVTPPKGSGPKAPSPIPDLFKNPPKPPLFVPPDILDKGLGGGAKPPIPGSGPPRGDGDIEDLPADLQPMARDLLTRPDADPNQLDFLADRIESLGRYPKIVQRLRARAAELRAQQGKGSAPPPLWKPPTELLPPDLFKIPGAKPTPAPTPNPYAPVGTVENPGVFEGRKFVARVLKYGDTARGFSKQYTGTEERYREIYPLNPPMHDVAFVDDQGQRTGVIGAWPWMVGQTVRLPYEWFAKSSQPSSGPLGATPVSIFNQALPGLSQALPGLSQVLSAPAPAQGQGSAFESPFGQVTDMFSNAAESFGMAPGESFTPLEPFTTFAQESIPPDVAPDMFDAFSNQSALATQNMFEQFSTFAPNETAPEMFAAVQPFQDFTMDPGPSAPPAPSGDLTFPGTDFTFPSSEMTLDPYTDNTVSQLGESLMSQPSPPFDLFGGGDDGGGWGVL